MSNTVKSLSNHCHMPTKTIGETLFFSVKRRQLNCLELGNFQACAYLNNTVHSGFDWGPANFILQQSEE